MAPFRLLVPLAISSMVPALAAASPLRAGAVVTGADPLAAGGLQHAIDARLAAISGVEARGAAAEAAVIGKTLDPPALDLALKKKIADLLDEVAKAYYDDRMDRALARLGDIEAATSGVPGVAASDRAQVLLWRAAVGLNKKEKASAEGWARSALVLDPSLTVDLKVFPPSVKELTDSLRAAGFKTVMVTLTGLPAGASPSIDDRPVPAGGARVPAGSHTLVVSAPGFRPVTAPIDAARDLTIDVPLAVAVDPALGDALAGMVARGSVEDADAARLDALAAAAKLDVLVVAAVVPGAAPSAPAAERAVVWRADHTVSPAVSDPVATDAGGRKALLEWIAGRVGAGRTAESPGPASPWTWRPEALAGAVLRVHELSGESGYRASFAGAGTRAGISVQRGGWVGEAIAGVDSFAFSHLSVDLPAGGTDRVSGGGWTGAQLRGGFRAGAGAASVTAELVARAERFSGHDISDGGGALGLIPGHTWESLGVLGSASVPLVRIGPGPLEATASAGFEPIVVYRETPAGTTGTHPRASAVDGGAGLAWSGSGWRIGAIAAADLRTVKFHGAGSSRLTPVPQDATVTDDLYRLSLTVTRAFP